jgi:hypothetical protein
MYIKPFLTHLPRKGVFSIQKSHEKCLSPLCTARCRFRKEREMNLLLHTLHEKGRSLVCILRWTLRLELWVNVSLEILHKKGRSPMWIPRCEFRLESCVNLLSHTLHGKDRSPVCSLRCMFRPFFSYTHCTRRVILQCVPWDECLRWNVGPMYSYPLCMQRVVLHSILFYDYTHQRDKWNFSCTHRVKYADLGLSVLPLHNAHKWTMWQTFQNATSFLCQLQLYDPVSSRNHISLNCAYLTILHSLHQEAPRP